MLGRNIRVPTDTEQLINYYEFRIRLCLRMYDFFCLVDDLECCH